MLFSVLLPTRNRLDLLSYAVETVRRQDYEKWELIVSDNCSEDDVEGFVASLNDPRIKYYRTESFVPVTNNWSNALEKCLGDYVIMLGDDDCLMKGYFSTLKKIIDEHNSPDLVYTSAFLYAYPNVLPGLPDGFLRSYDQRSIFKSENKPFWLTHEEKCFFAKSSLNFKMQFDYNMQFSLVSRSLINSMKGYGDFYQSPYPDYYASNAMMLSDAKVLVVPQSLVTIGISPKSFGYYYFNDEESSGSEFLRNLPEEGMAERLKSIILPGTDMNTSWLLAMETLIQNFGESSGLCVNYKRYRLLQICSVYYSLIHKKKRSKSVVKALNKKLTIKEKIIYGFPLRVISLFALMLPDRYRLRVADLIIRFADSHPVYAPPNISGHFNTILDVFEKVSVRSAVSIQKK